MNTTSKICILAFLLSSVQPLLSQDRFALLIGVDYKKPVPKLTWTTRDAIEFGKVLKNNFGYQVKTLTTPQETTRKRIVKEFSNLKKNGHKYEQIIIFFSGHGVQDEGSGDVGYLLPYDVDPTDYYSSAIDMGTFQNISKTLKSKQVLFILDCCYSGIIGSYHTMDVTFGDPKKANVSKRRRSRQIITAGLSDQTARIYPAQKLSVFTHFLLKALSYEEGYLGADAYGKGEVNLWDLQSYVRDKVTAYTNDAQTPGLYNYTNNDGIFLFKGKKPPAPEVDDSRLITNKLPIIKKTDSPPADTDIRTPEYNLRKSAKIVSHKDRQEMVKRYSFFDKYDNKTGQGIRHEFEKKKNGKVIYDGATGLSWQQSGSAKHMKFENTQAYISQLNRDNYAGYSDWRLPTLEEAMSLMAPTGNKNGFYIDPIFASEQSWIWTADKESASRAWFVNFFGYCDLYDIDVSFVNFVRAVR